MKTLKDMLQEGNDDLWEDFTFALASELREEAKNWVKALKEFDDPYLDSIVTWIEHFFNLGDETSSTQKIIVGEKV